MNLTNKFKCLFKVIRQLTLICCLSIIGVSFYLVGNSAYDNIKARKYVANDDNKIKTKAIQQLWFHGNGGDYNLNETVVKSVNFTQTFKNIYISTGFDGSLKANKMVNSVNQETIYDENCCSGNHFNNNHDYEIKDRIQNWRDYYLNDLYIGNIVPREDGWGMADADLLLSNNELWNIGVEHKQIKNNIVFGLENNYPKIFRTGANLNFEAGFKKELWNKNFEIYGINTSYMKESGHVTVVYNWVNRYFWALHGFATIKKFSCLETIGQKLKVNLFSLDNVLQLKRASWKEKSVIVTWSDLLTFDQKQTLETLLKNGDMFLEYASQKVDGQDELEWNKVVLNSKTIDEGIKIFINKNSEGVYKISKLKLTMSEFINENIFAQESCGSEFVIKDENILQNNNDFFLRKNEIKEIFFLNLDFSYVNFSVNQVSNEELLKRHVLCVDIYNEEEAGDVLDEKYYEILRDQQKGQITIFINYIEKKEVVLDGFIGSQKSDFNVDVQMFTKHKIASEIEGNDIKNILLWSGFEQGFLEKLSFDFRDKNNEEGFIKFVGNDVANQNYNFNLFNFEKYFCKKRSNHKNLLPSKYDQSVVFKYLLECSQEFSTRNCSNWKIYFNSDDKNGKLKINLVTDYENLEFDFNDLPTSKNFSQWLILSGVVLILITVIVFIWLYRNNFSIKNHKFCHQ